MKEHKVKKRVFSTDHWDHYSLIIKPLASIKHNCISYSPARVVLKRQLCDYLYEKKDKKLTPVSETVQGQAGLKAASLSAVQAEMASYQPNWTQGF